MQSIPGKWGYDCLNTTGSWWCLARASLSPPFSALNGHTLIRPLLINQLWYLSWLHFLTTLFIRLLLVILGSLQFSPFIRAFASRVYPCAFLWLDRISSRCYSIMGLQQTRLRVGSILTTPPPCISRVISLLYSPFLLDVWRITLGSNNMVKLVLIRW